MCLGPGKEALDPRKTSGTCRTVHAEGEEIDDLYKYAEGVAALLR